MPRFILPAFLFMALSLSAAAQQPGKDLYQTLPPDQRASTWLFYADGDQVTVSKPGTVFNGDDPLGRTLNWQQQLQFYGIHQDQEKIMLYPQKQVVKPVFSDYYLRMVGKRLRITWEMQIDSFRAKERSWRAGYIRPAYEQFVYVDKSVLKITGLHAVFETPHLNQQALRSTDSLFEAEKKRHDTYAQFHLIRQLFFVAASGNKQCQERLMHFGQYFTIDPDNAQTFAENQALLKAKLGL
jgi:hypothetical protein